MSLLRSTSAVACYAGVIVLVVVVVGMGVGDSVSHRDGLLVTRRRTQNSLVSSGVTHDASERAAYCTTSAGVLAASNAVQTWATGARHPTIPFYSRTLTVGGIAALHQCATDLYGDTQLSDFSIIIMGSAAKRDRLVTLRSGWGARVAAAGARSFVVSDVVDAELGTIVLSGAGDPSYAGAQNRSLEGLRYAVRESPESRWYWMVDDDTYFNADEVLAIVRYIQWRIPIVMGHIFRGMLRFRNVAGSWPSGGAGMLLTRDAAHKLAGKLSALGWAAVA